MLARASPYVSTTRPPLRRPCPVRRRREFEGDLRRTRAAAFAHQYKKAAQSARAPMRTPADVPVRSSSAIGSCIPVLTQKATAVPTPATFSWVRIGTVFVGLHYFRLR